MLPVLVRRRGGGTNAFDLEGHIQNRWPFEVERAGKALVFLQWPFQIQEHEMNRVGPRRHRTLCGNRNAISQLRHLHRAAGHAHFVNLNTPSHIRGPGDEPSWAVAGILDGEVAGSDLCSARCRA